MTLDNTIVGRAHRALEEMHERVEMGGLTEPSVIEDWAFALGPVVMAMVMLNKKNRPKVEMGREL